MGENVQIENRLKEIAKKYGVIDGDVLPHNAESIAAAVMLDTISALVQDDQLDTSVSLRAIEVILKRWN